MIRATYAISGADRSRAFGDDTDVSPRLVSRLHPSAKPRFSPASIGVKRGNRSRFLSTEPSAEPLLTTTTTSRWAFVWASSDTAERFEIVLRVSVHDDDGPEQQRPHHQRVGSVSRRLSLRPISKSGFKRSI